MLFRLSLQEPSRLLHSTASLNKKINNPADTKIGKLDLHGAPVISGLSFALDKFQSRVVPCGFYWMRLSVRAHTKSNLSLKGSVKQPTLLQQSKRPTGP